MDVFKLLRNWFNWSFENPELITPNHTALYVFTIEHCNRLGWKEKFGLPTSMAKDALGIKSYNTYKKTLDDLVKWGFIEMIELSKNQYSSNIVALSKFDKAHDKALDKASAKHMTKQSESTVQSIDSIDIHNTNYIIHNTECVQEEKKDTHIVKNDLENSNLFRQPKIPTIEEVKYHFRLQGGTEEMAIKFFESNNGTGWFLRGSPIVNFQSLIYGYVEAWKKNDLKNPKQQKPGFEQRVESVKSSSDIAAAIQAEKEKNKYN